MLLKISRSGGTGRRPGLKILWEEIPVPVRPRPWAPVGVSLAYSDFFMQTIGTLLLIGKIIWNG